MTLSIHDQRLIDQIQAIGCGAPLGSSGHLKMFCEFQIHLCAHCKEKKEMLAANTPATAWMATILHLAEALDQPSADPPDTAEVPARV